MSLKEKIVRALKQAVPKTWVAGGGSIGLNLFSERKRNKNQLEKYGLMYDQGGIVSEAIDTYADYHCRNGYVLEGPDSEVKKVEDWMKTVDFISIVKAGIRDARGIYGDAFQEIVSNVDGTPARVIPRTAGEFEMHYDDHGELAVYTQKTMIRGIEKTATLKPDQVLHLQFKRAAKSMYGLSLIHQAYDDIMRDATTAESSAEAIKRHGYKKYHISVGREGDTRDVPEDTLDKISAKFKDLNEKNDFTTTRNIELKSIDEGGLDKIDVYNDVSIMRMAAALGVPEELLGLRRGSTDATAAKRIDTFYGKVASMQPITAQVYTLNIIDRITSKPGMVELIWNDPTPLHLQQKTQKELEKIDAEIELIKAQTASLHAKKEESIE